MYLCFHESAHSVFINQNYVYLYKLGDGTLSQGGSCYVNLMVMGGSLYLCKDERQKKVVLEDEVKALVADIHQAEGHLGRYKLQNKYAVYGSSAENAADGRQ